MANSFTRNTLVVSGDVEGPLDVVLIGALAAALPSNSTLPDLSFLLGSSVDAAHLSPVFLALGTNTGLKKLKFSVLDMGNERTAEAMDEVMDDVMDESLCIAIKNGLELNETLESPEVRHIPLRDDNTDLWSWVFSFLRTNKVIKSLVVDMKLGVTESCLPAFIIDMATTLQENTPLQSLSIRNSNKLITALQHNTTLKALSLSHPFRPLKITLTDDNDKEISALLKKNYTMKRLPDIDLENEAKDARLNEAGHRYLIQDGSSISAGVEVLRRVTNDTNCLFLHLLESPRLCDRRAVEMVTISNAS